MAIIEIRNSYVFIWKHYLYILFIYKIMEKMYCNVYKCELYRMASLRWWLHDHPFGHKVLHGIQ